VTRPTSQVLKPKTYKLAQQKQICSETKLPCFSAKTQISLSHNDSFTHQMA